MTAVWEALGICLFMAVGGGLLVMQIFRSIGLWGRPDLRFAIATAQVAHPAGFTLAVWGCVACGMDWLPGATTATAVTLVSAVVAFGWASYDKRHPYGRDFGGFRRLG